MLALVAGGAPAPVHDTPTIAGVELVWSAPEGCPTAAEVLMRMQTLLGERPADAPPVRLEGTIRAADDTFVLDLQAQTASGRASHDLASPDCRALGDAAALVGAVAADPLTVERTIARPPVLEGPEPDDGVTVTKTPPVVMPPRRRGRLKLARFGLRADALLESGPLPELAFGPVVTVGLLGPLWRAEIGAVFLVPRPHFVDDAKTMGATFGTWGIRARGCGVPVVRIVEFPVCGGFEGGQMTARLQGDLVGDDLRRPFGLFTLGAGVGVSPRPFLALLLGVDGVVALTRPRFEVDALLLHRPQRFGVRATLGLELRVP